jgi:transcriptional regulator with XRE-family HTH domain
MKNLSSPNFEYERIFAKRMKGLRKKKGLSQKQLAQMLEIGQPTISNYEKAVSFPGPNMLVSICNHLETSIDYILGQSNCPSPEELPLQRKFECLTEVEKELINQCINIFYKKNQDE